MADNNYMSAMDRLLSEVKTGGGLKPSTTASSAPKTQPRRTTIDEDMGNSAINAIRSKVKRADQEVANIQKSRKNSRIFNAVESFGDFLPVFESATERVKANRDQVAADAETDIQDIIRSRDQINRSGGYGKGGYGAAVERGLGNLQATRGALGVATGYGDEEDVGNIIEGRNRSKMAGARNQSEQEAYERFQAADGIIGSAKEIFSNFRLLTNVAVESLPSSLPSMALGAVGGVAGGIATRSGKGAQTGASIGTGIGSFATEYGNTMLETFAENGVDLDDPESVKAAMADKELMSDARWRGTRRGIAVGAFDAMSVALAGKMGGAPVARTIIGDTAKAGLARKATGLLAAGAVETVGQGTLGAAGEAAGQLAADGRITSPQDIVAEFAGEIPSGVVESIGGTAVRLGADSASSTAEDDELASALRARAAANPVTQVAGQIEGPNVGEMRDLGSMRVAGMTMTPDQVLEFAQNNQSQPRIADILSQPVSDVTKVEQVARILNEQEAARVEPEAVRRISSLVGGTNPTSQSRQFITDELTKIGDEVVAASPTLSAIRDTVASERGGKQFVGTLRGIVENYSPPAQQGETFFARPERGGEGSVVMTPDQIADEAKRERDAQEAFRLAGVRQQRFDEATGTGAQREDLRAGASDPQAQFFLNPEAYGEALGGVAATIVGAENGMVRIQYESPTETGRDGRPVTISEEVDPAAMFDRVVRGTPRMSQELAGDVRTPRRGTGTDLNPRNSVDRTSTRALVPTQDAGLPATISPTRLTGFEANTDQLPVETQNAQADQQTQPNVEGILEAPPAPPQATQAALPAPAPQLALPAPTPTPAPVPAAKKETPPAPKAAEPAATEEDTVVEDEEVDVDNDPRMVEHNQRFDDAVESIQDTENATEVRKLAKKLIREGVVDEDAYADIDERMKDVPLTERWDEGMSALEDAIEEQRDTLASDIEEEIYSEADEKASSNAAESTDAKQDVHNELTDAEKDVLADHYGEPEYNGAAKTRFIEDLVTAVNKGLQSVDKKIRAIVKRISLLTLSAAVVFSPMSLTGPSIPQARAQDIAYNETLHRAVPVAARGKMSVGAQRVYETMAPVATQNGKSFFIADKPNGMIHAFAANGSYMASAPSLYGKAAGDVLTEGRNEANRTEDVTDSGKVTPAGTFKLEAGKGSYTGGYVLYLVDPKTGVGVGANKAGGGAIVAVHSVYNGTASENREGRLDTDTANDNKISFGCINTAEEFFVDNVRPNIESFDGGMVFVMPDDVSQTSKLFSSKQPKGSPTNPSTPSQPALPTEDAARPTRKEPERRVGDQKDGKPEEGTTQETRYSGRSGNVTEDNTAVDPQAPTIDYDAVISDRLEKIAARGRQGKVIAERLRALLKNTNFTPLQQYYAFRMGEVLATVLPKGANVDVDFVSSLLASDEKAAANSGTEVGKETGGEFTRFKTVSAAGFRGLITMSLSENVMAVARENASHEAFHVIQDMLKAYDPQAFAQLNQSFSEGMTLDQLDASILRKLKTLTMDGEQSVYDSLKDNFGDVPFSLDEAQAVAFGALSDAKDRGQSMKGLKASFIRIVDMLSDFRRAMGNLLRRDGIKSPADIFAGYSSGKAQESLTGPAPLSDEIGAEAGVQYSGRRKDTETGKFNKNIKPEKLSADELFAQPDVKQGAMGVTEAAIALQQRTLSTLGRPITAAGQQDELLASTVAHEVKSELARSGKRNASGWYTEEMRRASAVAALMHPEIATDVAAQLHFTAALAITSQNQSVDLNAIYAERWYEFYAKNGKFPENEGWGKAASSIMSNAQLFNSVVQAYGAEAVSQFFATKYTVRELKAAGFGNVSGAAEEMVYGSAVLGPKIGFGFYSNLNGRYDPVTIDMWFMRTWGRMTGDLIGASPELVQEQEERLTKALAEDGRPTNAYGGELVEVARAEAKAFEKDFKVNRADYDSGKKVKSEVALASQRLIGSFEDTKDAPKADWQRTWIRDIVSKAQEILKRGKIDITNADLQAILWYPEKRLWSKKFGVREKGKGADGAGSAGETSYYDEFVRIAKKQGFTDEQINASIQPATGGGQGSGRVLGGETVNQETDGKSSSSGGFSPRDARRFIQDAIITRLNKEFPILDGDGSNASGRSSEHVSRKSGGNLARNLEGRVPVVATYSHTVKVKNAFSVIGIDAPKFLELTSGTASAKLYHRLISDAQKANKAGAAVQVYDQAEYTDMRLFLTEDGLTGFALKDDDLVSVFKHPSSDQRGVAIPLARMAVWLGARRLDAFDTVLPSIYSTAGFKVAARIRWSEEQAPKNWDKKTFADYNDGEPDVVFMYHDSQRSGFYSKGEGPMIEDYNAAVEAQKDAAGNVQYSGRRGAIKFDAWFGDSKIVDDNGEPLVVYHGTKQDIDAFSETVESKNNRGNIKGFFFSTSKSMAGGYGPNTVSAYLKMEKPFVVGETNIPQEMLDEYRVQLIKTNRQLDAQSDANWFDGKVADLRSNKKVSGTALNGNGAAHQATVKAGGFDGIIDGHEHAVFTPTQIKSAEENNGNFDPQDPRINYSGRRGALRAGQGPAALRPAPSFTADNYNFGGAEPTRTDDVIFKLQDKLIDLKRVQESITASGRQIDDKANVYRNEELYYGRAAKRSKQFLKKELAPLIEDMKSKGVSLKMIDEFLHARHAKERNAQIAKINDQMPDGGSGLTNAQVDSYLNGLPNVRRRQLENLANRVDAIIANTQKLMVEYGLETQETIDTWNKTYQSYVPLQREGFEEADGAAVGGNGMSVRGSSSRRALGSNLSVVDILANVAMQREKIISRGERNRIGNSLVAMALQNPNDSFWYVIDPKSADAAKAKQKLIDFGMTPPDAENVMGSPTQRFIDPNSGRVTYAPNSLFMNAPNVMATRINGEDKFVIFNTRNPRSKRLVESLKAVGAAQLGSIMNGFGKVTRYLAAINTQYNPAFGLYNLMRDLQGAALNLSTTPLAGKQKSVIANALPATIGMYRDLRAERGGKTASTNWAALAEEFENEGGKTGYRDLFTSSTERADAIENELTGGSKLRQVATKTGGPVLNWLSDFNEAIENGVRLSAYKEGLDMGLSKAEAASVAKNLTVNFNRKGAMTAQAGALYAFFNAAVQGTARLGETLTGPAGKKIVMGGLLLGVAQAMALAAAGLEDEPEWLKDKNFIIPLGGGKYVAFPMPLGFHAIPAMSRRAVEFMMSDKSVGVQAVGLLGMFADAFNPVGNAGLSAQTIAPTFADPLVALGENQDFAGRQIYKEDFNTNDPTAGPSRNREGVSAVGAAISTAIDYIAGGNGYTAGAISPTGDVIDYMIGQATGGVGRLVLNTVSTAEAVATGEDLPNYKIPIVGRMIGDANEAAAVSNRFYQGVKEMNGHKRSIEGMEEDGKDTASYLKDYPEANFYMDAQRYERDVTKLNKERKALKADGAPQSEIDAVIEEQQMLMNEFNQQVADYKRK